MNNEQERFERSCEILLNLSQRRATAEELADLTSLMGLRLTDWVPSKREEQEALETIHWGGKAA